jgi:hypothetical protein
MRGMRSSGKGRSSPPKRKMTLPLWPPKPNEFDRMTSTSRARGADHDVEADGSGSTSVVPAVGGMVWFSSVNTEATPSRAPAAASECPRWPLIEVTGAPCHRRPCAWRPIRRGRSAGVEVPWALMCETSLGRESGVGQGQLHAAHGPAALGSGAVMWWASAVEAAPMTSARLWRREPGRAPTLRGSGRPRLHP